MTCAWTALPVCTAYVLCHCMGSWSVLLQQIRLNRIVLLTIVDYNLKILPNFIIPTYLPPAIKYNPD